MTNPLISLIKPHDYFYEISNNWLVKADEHGAHYNADSECWVLYDINGNCYFEEDICSYVGTKTTFSWDDLYQLSQGKSSPAFNTARNELASFIEERLGIDINNRRICINPEEAIDNFLLNLDVCGIELQFKEDGSLIPESKNNQHQRQIDITKQSLNCIDEILFFEEDGLNFTYELWFDVDKYFGTNTKSYDNSWINFYTFWLPDGTVSAYVVVDNQPDSYDSFEWELTEDEKAFFLKKMEDYCQMTYSQSLSEFYQEAKEEHETVVQVPIGLFPGAK